MFQHVQAAPIASSIVAQLVSDPANGSRRKSFAAGTTVHGPDGAAEYIFLIHVGEVRVYQFAPDGNSRLLEILGPGEWFGAASLGRQKHYGCSAVAVSSSTLSIISAQKLLAALPNYPQAAVDIIRHLAAQLAAATQEASHLTFDDCQKRLVKALLKFSRSAAATRTGDGVVLRITHEQLAQAVGAARETISLALTQLRQANLLRTGRNRLSFNPERLGHMAHDGIVAL